MGKLDGKVAVITAGTSGMALATAKLFVEEGAYVFITGRDQQKLDAAVQSVGRNVTGVQADSSTLADLDRLFEKVKAEKGQIDVLFASAGGEVQKPFALVTPQDFDLQFGLNARGTFFTVQKALPLLRKNAAIILNGSVATIKGVPGMTAYAGSKAAMHAFARSWAFELREQGIRTNVISPGPIDTPAMVRIPVEMQDHFKTLVPKGRFGHVDEIATAALFLATNDFVNGIELYVDGGFAQI